jgi:pentatricopeptide repeat protein
MRDIEIIYRRLFEACGTCRLQDEILDLFNDMKKNKIDPDKVTFGTYYQAFQVSKKPIAAPGSIGPFTDNSTYQALGINKKESYLKYSPEDFQQKL